MPGPTMDSENYKYSSGGCIHPFSYSECDLYFSTLDIKRGWAFVRQSNLDGLERHQHPNWLTKKK